MSVGVSRASSGEEEAKKTIEILSNSDVKLVELFGCFFFGKMKIEGKRNDKFLTFEFERKIIILNYFKGLFMCPRFSRCLDS